MMSKQITNDNSTVRSSELESSDFVGVSIDSGRFVVTRTSMGHTNFLVTNFNSVYGRYDGITINALVGQLLKKDNVSAIKFDTREAMLHWVLEPETPEQLKPEPVNF